ncbi:MULTISPECIES: nitric oxide reductase activation protein NorD [Acidithiobacillus]|uniref:von Willebrand factor type A domain protein n=4 Tax=Bacteria TaxID=2 RepID=B7JB16_ACIF2|nr:MULTISPECIES: VWA domain-containing protein [Acidithiobacillus]AGF34174.1 von Willebrand factor type A domain protein [uncultured bacterium DX-8J-22]ACH83608.1 von Willebrand factor type A [Acidithiobacillus ferrooxidans ATCC 53993]ACK80817.1 von Willebrand factor type A domain protein [Acidithiobacillus ferrooxidans ATCC 23270]MBN6744163.1 VWA domain-containing protein [Acidithiobacillus sp. MC2.2]MBN6747576.1 VWA domain-containing protein [Acidithiobacillus sp. PG05]
MAVELEKYQDILAELGEHAVEVLRASWDEAARVFTPRGLENYYLNGATSLKSLGRGTDLVVSFIQSAPAVAHELGEDAVREMLAAAIKMYSKTSATVIAAMFSSSPVAAARLGDPELFRGYLHLLDTLLAQAPRGVRPMLDHLSTLLGQLTLGGLRRWALWGAQAHKTDFDGQAKYFALESPESIGVLQKERKGTLFIDVQRRISMYLRALWGRDFFMRPTSGDFEQREGYRPSIEGYIIHLPDAYDDLVWQAPSGEETHIHGIELYRASAAHAACHQVYTTDQFDSTGLSTLQSALIGLIEDARVETIALKQFPGLRHIWLPLHTATPASGNEAASLMARLAHALLDPDYRDDHPWVAMGRQIFSEQQERLVSTEWSREVGLRLAAEMLQLGVAYSATTDVPDIPYRDDNRYMWEFEDIRADGQVIAGVTTQQIRKYVSVMEMVNALDVPGAGDDANEIWVLSSEFFRDEEPTSLNQQEGREPPPDPYHYPEWDYQMQLERPEWCTVLEKRAKSGTLETIHEIVAKHKPIIGRLKFLIEALQPQGVQRLRKQEDGDEIDLNAAVRAMIEMRMGEQPDPRIMMRNVRKVRDLSVLLLIDLSESTNDPVLGSNSTVLQLAREATVLLADALDKIGDPFAIHGFDSNGRHDVEYFRYKDFGASYNDQAKSRLAGMSGQLSTRMGAAIRHAGSILKRQPSNKKLLLVITDGEPADNDVRDPQYLRYDARKAVEDLTQAGIAPYCLSLDPRADQYVSRIFGAKNYVVLDHVQRLPEKLPILYMGLTR